MQQREAMVTDTSSIKGLVQHQAELHGLALLPHSHNMDGQMLYKLGDRIITIENSVIYQKMAGGGNVYKPISIRELFGL